MKGPKGTISSRLYNCYRVQDIDNGQEGGRRDFGLGVVEVVRWAAGLLGRCLVEATGVEGEEESRWSTAFG